MHTCLIAELRAFLSAKSHPRARFLLNVPDLVHQERKFRDDGGNNGLSRCLLVLDDVTYSKRCSPPDFAALESGLRLRETRVLLATLAQFHAVGLAWKLGGRCGAKDESSSSTALAFLLREAGPGLGDAVRRGGTTKEDDGGGHCCECGDCDACAVAELLDMYERFLRWRQRIRRNNRTALANE